MSEAPAGAMLCALALAGGMFCAVSSAAPPDRVPPVFAPSVDLEDIAPFLNRIYAERGTIILHSDSRTLYGGHGIQAGLEYAFSRPGMPGLYGTPAFSPGRNNGLGDGLGHGWTNNNGASHNAGISLDRSALPEVIQPYADPMEVPVRSVNALTPGGGAMGIIALAESWLSLAGDVRLDVWHGVDPDGTSVLPRRRLDAPPYTYETSTEIIPSRNDAPGIRRSDVTWTSQQAGWMNENQAVMLSNPNAGLPEEFRVHLLQVTRPSKQSGVVVGTRHKGGNSAIDNYNDIFPAVNDPMWTDDGRRFMLNAATMHSDGWLLVVTYLDVNDRNEALPSVHGITPGDSPAAYRDNIESTLDAYDAMAPDACRVFHLLVGSPQLSGTKNDKLIEFHQELAAIAADRERTAFLNLQTVLPDNQQLIAMGVFSHSNDVHQTEFGSMLIGAAIVDALYDATIPAPFIDDAMFTCAVSCPADCSPMRPDGSTGDGAVNIDDLVAVLNAYGGPSEQCDITPLNPDGSVGNGSVNLDDLIAVLISFGDCG
ncbi:MAG: hypothetical protein KC983_05325 [Phycisphaerales bacterium]|nr:hypothetical protein [Phycisphaerales bacterium]